MDRYDTDLWCFLKDHDETSLGLPDRLKLAVKFQEKVKEIGSFKESGNRVRHRDLKPSNVLLNLRPDGQWNGEMEITDFGIADIGYGKQVGAGTSGWAEGSLFIHGSGSDYFAARLVVFMILLSWNTAWAFIWDGTPIGNSANLIEKLFMKYKDGKDIPNLLSEIVSRIVSQTFIDEWALYCRSATSNIPVDSNTQRSVNVEMVLSQINLDEQAFVTDGTKLHGQDLSNLCHSFCIVTSLRRELCNTMEGKTIFRNKTPLDVLNEGSCSFKNFLIVFVAEISPRSLHGLAGKDSNQREISAQFCDLEKGINRLVYPTRAFEQEGWKRIDGVKRFFRSFGFEESYQAAFELSSHQVGHPNSATNAQFYPTAQSLGIIASPLQIPPMTFDCALAQKHYVIA